MSRHGLDGFRGDLEEQRKYFSTRLPVYDRLLAIVDTLVDEPGASVHEAAWRERDFSAAYERPLLLLAALRFDALRSGAEHPLHAAIAVEAPDPAALTRESVAAAVFRAGVEELLRTRRVQTNEVSRAVAWRWPVWLVRGNGRPIALVDVGASAGLNLIAGALPARWTDDAGALLPVAGDERVVARLGLDRHPLDARDDGVADWLRACVWPGDNDRLAALEAALAAFRAAPPDIEALDAVDAPARLARLRRDLGPEPLLIAYQSVVRDYLPPSDRVAYVAGMHDWLASEPTGAMWIELETAPHGVTREWPAALTAHVAGATHLLARCAYHPTALRIDAVAVAAFTAALA
jgi:hypothetical protein